MSSSRFSSQSKSSSASNCEMNMLVSSIFSSSVSASLSSSVCSCKRFCTTESGKISSSSFSVQRGYRYPSLCSHPCPSAASSTSGWGMCALFQIATWKLTLLTCCFKLPLQGGRVDRSTFRLDLIFSSPHFSFSMLYLRSLTLLKCFLL